MYGPGAISGSSILAVPDCQLSLRGTRSGGGGVRGIPIMSAVHWTLDAEVEGRALLFTCTRGPHAATHGLYQALADGQSQA